jgi:hypothetical protein
VIRAHGIMNADFAEPHQYVPLFDQLLNKLYQLFFPVERTPSQVIDLHRQNWETQLPVLETLTRQQVIDRYGVNPEHALIVSRGTRGQPLDQEETIMIDEGHSFVDALVETEKDKFALYSVGKYAFPWPKGILETLFYIFNTQRGVIRTCDENNTYLHRHHAAYAMQANEAQIKRFFEKLRQDIFKERQNEIIFQAQGNNCGVWVEETLDYVFQDPNRPHLYEISYLEGGGPSIIGYILGFLRFLAKYISETVSNIARVMISFSFGAWRGYTTGIDGSGTTHRLLNDKTWKGKKLTIPGALFRFCKEDSKENMKGYYNKLKIGHASVI